MRTETSPSESRAISTALRLLAESVAPSYAPSTEARNLRALALRFERGAATGVAVPNVRPARVPYVVPESVYGATLFGEYVDRNAVAFPELEGPGEPTPVYVAFPERLGHLIADSVEEYRANPR